MDDIAPSQKPPKKPVTLKRKSTQRSDSSLARLNRPLGQISDSGIRSIQKAKTKSKTSSKKYMKARLP